jgi:zeta-carotene desaturase
MTPDVIVVGGGFAGLSAATALAERGARVLVVEARATLGGRASSFTDPATGERVDNGQHLMLGCYHETFAFLRRIGTEAGVQVQADLEAAFVDRAGRRTTLRCPPLLSPWHLLAGLLEWDALAPRDRFSAFNLAGSLRRARRFVAKGKGYLPASPGETVENWLVRNGQSARLREMLWDPLALAALNQEPAHAAAPVFVRVLARMFGPDRRDSAIALPLIPLSDLYVEPARRFLEARGGEVRTSSPARVLLEGGRFAAVVCRGERLVAPSAIAAVPWFALPDLFDGDTARISGMAAAAAGTAPSPIVTVNLWFDRPVLDVPYLGLPGRTFQWVFDKRQVFGASANHLSFVSSGAVPVVARSNESLAALAAAELFEAVPEAAGARVLRSVVVREKRATFSLAPGQPDRPPGGTPIRGLFLAGDWIDTGLPATIEGAVISGHRAADHFVTG